jgi:4-carboxymuconolactone decarboxylase
MSDRLAQVTREQLTAEGQAAWDRIVGTRGGVRGPFQVLINVPNLAERIADLGTYLRFEGLLTGADRELAVLTVAREMGSRFEWVGHERIAREEGVRPEAIEIVRTQGGLDGLTERERMVVEVVHSLAREHQIPDELFARARDALGQARLVELTALAGYYCMMAFALVGFEVEPSGGERPF